MFKYLVELLKGFLLEFRGAKVRRVALEVEEPRLLQHEFMWNVHVVENSMKVRVFDLREEESHIIVKEGCFRVTVGTGTLSPPPLAMEAKGFFPLLEYPKAFHHPMITRPIARRIDGMRVEVLSDPSLPPLWKRRVRREGRVEREKIERALRVLHEMIRREEIRSVTFSGYFRNVPNGTIRIVGNDLIVDVIKSDFKSQDLFVFKILTEDNKTKYVFISLS